MKKNKIIKIISSIVLVLFVTLTFKGITYAISSKEQAKIVAEDGLTKMLKMVKANYKDFGFNSEDDVDKAKLGEPFENYTVDLEKFDKNKKLDDQMMQMTFYDFPVMVDDYCATDLTVCLDKGIWKVVDIGGSKRIKKIYNNVRDNNLLETKILRVGYGSFVIAKKSDKDINSIVKTDEILDRGVKTQNLTQSESVSDDTLNNLIEEYKAEYEKYKDKGTDIIGGGVGRYSGFDTKFEQKSIPSRLGNYVKHLLP